MATPTQYQIIHPPAQNAMGGSHLHTPQSIFQHMMGQQNVSNQSSGPWPQMPQVPPMMMPWSIPSLQQSQLVRFTGERPQASYGKPLHVKRKLLAPDVAETHRAKQFITEEKMAAHFQDMHISGDYSRNATTSGSTMNEPRPCCSTSRDEIPLDLDLECEPAGLENGKSVHPRLVISEELKRLQQDSVLPGSLLAKMESRPSMALVLWEPPSKHLRMLSNRQNIRQFPSLSSNIGDDGSDNGSGSNNNNNSMMSNEGLANNNHENIRDLNESIAEEESNIEPMDL